MGLRMTLKARMELANSIRPHYLEANWQEKRSLLDGFALATGYSRKHAITVLGRRKPVSGEKGKRRRQRTYDEAVKETLVKVWLASNRLCSKRLVPFLPELVERLEYFGHLEVAPDIRSKLLSLSVSTTDRLLKEEKKKYGRPRGTTRPGRLLKKHIPVRTFAEWTENAPGFLEGDLVAHCGGVAKGLFLNTLTVTDIFTQWVEFAVLEGKSEEVTKAGICEIQSLLPFELKGFDSDNGSEFMNFGIFEWCEEQGVTFTRSREYRKNDQAHVEEKNGSIVRRFVGYDRFEGQESQERLRQLYAVVRLYVNFFQPSMKLLYKERDGSRTRKRYDSAQTPYRRVLGASSVPSHVKRQLHARFKTLDPVFLLTEIERLQVDLWKTAAGPVPAEIDAGSLAQLLRDKKPANATELAQQVDQHRQRLKQRDRRPKVTETAKQHRNMLSVRIRILNHVRRLPVGQSFRAKDFLCYGLRAAIDKALQRMIKDGSIRRIVRGRYVLPSSVGYPRKAAS